VPSNVGKARTRSLQLEASFPLAALMQGAPPVELRANVARNWSSVDGVPGPSNRLDEQVPLSSNLGMDYQGERLSAGANFGFRSGGRVAVTVNQTVWQYAQRDLELYAAWRLDKTSQLRLSAANLLGTDMVNERSYLNTATGALLRSRVVNVGHPSLRLTLESRF